MTDGPNIPAEDQPLVSIVIPTYNEAGFIEECVATVLRQDYPPSRLEVLVVDGCSTDDTPDIVNRIARTHPQVRCLPNPRKIQAAAFNIGVAQARGDIIVRMDAHAKYDVSYVSKCVETLARTGAGNVGGIWEAKPGSDTLIAHAIAAINVSRFGTGGAISRVGGKAGAVDTVSFGAFPKEVLRKVGPMDERLVRDEDNELNARIRDLGYAVHFEPSIHSTYFTRSTVSALLRQMYFSGQYHVLAIKLRPGSCSTRHFVPLAFFLALAVSSLGGLLWRPLWIVAGSALALYLLVDLLASFQIAARKGPQLLLIVPWLLFLVHMTYGFGTLTGFFKFARVSPASRNGKKEA